MRPEIGAGDPARGLAGQQVQRRGEQQHGPRRGVAVAEGQPQGEGEPAADHQREGAQGRGERVRGDQLVSGHRRGQRGRQRGQDESVDRDDDQGRQPEPPAGDAGRQDRGDPDRERRAHDVGEHERLPAAPAVDEDADEGPEQRVRQQQDRERGRDGARGGLPLGREEHERGEPRLQGAVAGLAEQPGAQQPAEVRDAGDLDELAGAGAAGVPGVVVPRVGLAWLLGPGHGRTLRRPCGRSCLAERRARASLRQTGGGAVNAD